MKGLYRYLAPFPPDQSGAAAVLFELGGMSIVLDAGGCTGNICGFDEPRWFRQKSAIYSAGLRDMDAIMGRDDRLVDKIGDAIKTTKPRFVALIGTPVSSVIATDYNAVCKMIMKKYEIPAIYIETYGMEFYERGEYKAYKAIIDNFVGEAGKTGTTLTSLETTKTLPNCDIGIWGATPLNLPALDSAKKLRKRFEKLGMKAVTFGMDSGLDGFELASTCKKNIAVSPSGYMICKYLEKRYGTPFECGFFMDAFEADAEAFAGTRKILIVHQQIFANEMRRLIRKALPAEVEISVASFFKIEKEISEDGDYFCKEENEFISYVSEGKFDLVVGDPLYERAFRNSKIKFLDLPHFSVSGSIYEAESEEEYFRKLSWIK